MSSFPSLRLQTFGLGLIFLFLTFFGDKGLSLKLNHDIIFLDFIVLPNKHGLKLLSHYLTNTGGRNC